MLIKLIPWSKLFLLYAKILKNIIKAATCINLIFDKKT